MPLLEPPALDTFSWTLRHRAEIVASQPIEDEENDYYGDIDGDDETTEGDEFEDFDNDDFIDDDDEEEDDEDDEDDLDDDDDDFGDDDDFSDEEDLG